MSSSGPLPPAPGVAAPRPAPAASRRYSKLQALLLSFFSADLYKDVAKRWEGAGAAYLLLLVTLCWIPLLIQMQVGLSKFVREDAVKILSQLPPVTIDKGKVSTPVETPYFIKDPDNGKQVAILDLTGEITSLEGHDDAVLLLTQGRLITRQSKMEVREYDLSQVQHFEFTREKAQEWLGWLKDAFLFVAAPFCIFFSLLYRFVQALIYAAIGLIFAAALHAKLKYEELLRLAVVAITPVMILGTVYDLAGKGLPHWNLICFAVAMCYLFFAVRSAAQA